MALLYRVPFLLLLYLIEQHISLADMSSINTSEIPSIFETDTELFVATELSTDTDVGKGTTAASTEFPMEAAGVLTDASNHNGSSEPGITTQEETETTKIVSAKNHGSTIITEIYKDDVTGMISDATGKISTTDYGSTTITDASNDDVTGIMGETTGIASTAGHEKTTATEFYNGDVTDMMSETTGMISTTDRGSNTITEAYTDDVTGMTSETIGMVSATDHGSTIITETYKDDMTGVINTTGKISNTDSGSTTITEAYTDDVTGIMGETIGIASTAGHGKTTATEFYNGDVTDMMSETTGMISTSDRGSTTITEAYTDDVTGIMGETIGMISANDHGGIIITETYTDDVPRMMSETIGMISATDHGSTIITESYNNDDVTSVMTENSTIIESGKHTSTYLATDSGTDIFIKSDSIISLATESTADTIHSTNTVGVTSSTATETDIINDNGDYSHESIKSSILSNTVTNLETVSATLTHSGTVFLTSQPVYVNHGSETVTTITKTDRGTSTDTQTFTDDIKLNWLGGGTNDEIVFATEMFTDVVTFTDIVTDTIFTDGKTLIANITPYAGDMFAFFDPMYILVFGILMVISAVIISFSNGLVLLTFLSCPRLCTYFNNFSIGIAIADFVVGFCTLPSVCVQLFLGYWPLNPSLCAVFLYINHISTHASILCIVVLSYDRLISLTKPIRHKRRQSTKRAIGLMCIAYGLALIFWLPFQIYELIINELHPSGQCIPLMTEYPWFGIFISTIFFWIPLLAIITINIMTFHAVKRRRAKRKAMSKLPVSKHPQKASGRERTISTSTGDDTKKPSEGLVCGKNVVTYPKDSNSESEFSDNNYQKSSNQTVNHIIPASFHSMTTEHAISNENRAHRTSMNQHGGSSGENSGSSSVDTDSIRRRDKSYTCEADCHEDIIQVHHDHGATTSEHIESDNSPENADKYSDRIVFKSAETDYVGDEIKSHLNDTENCPPGLTSHPDKVESRETVQRISKKIDHEAAEDNGHPSEIHNQCIGGEADTPLDQTGVLREEMNTQSRNTQNKGDLTEEAEKAATAQKNDQPVETRGKTCVQSGSGLGNMKEFPTKTRSDLSEKFAKLYRYPATPNIHRKKSENVHESVIRRRVRESKRRAARTLTLLVVVMLATWAPWAIFETIITFCPSCFNWYLYDVSIQ